jgi:uncharacterized protein (TIGR03066 family)
MRVLGSVLAVCIVFLLIGEGRRAESQKDATNAEKLIGTWKLIKSGGKDVPVDISIEFGKDLKLVMMFKAGDKEQKIDGTYKLDGDKITTTAKIGDKEMIEVHTIQTLNDTTLITKDKKGQLDEFQKKKK